MKGKMVAKQSEKYKFTKLAVTLKFYPFTLIMKKVSCDKNCYNMKTAYLLLALDDQQSDVLVPSTV